MPFRRLVMSAIASLFGLGGTPAEIEAAPPPIEELDPKSPSGTGAATPAGGSDGPYRIRAVSRVLRRAEDQQHVRFGLSPWSEMVLGAYAEELSQSRGARAGPALARLLGAIPERERTWMVVRWALSPHAELRLALARAAALRPRAVGLPSALELLASDEDPEVATAARAALRSTAAG